MLVDGTALGRHIAPQSGQRLLQPSPAIDNQELRLAQPPLDEIVDHGAPSLAGLAAHILDRQQHLADNAGLLCHCPNSAEIHLEAPEPNSSQEHAPNGRNSTCERWSAAWDSFA